MAEALEALVKSQAAIVVGILVWSFPRIVSALSDIWLKTKSGAAKGEALEPRMKAVEDALQALQHRSDAHQMDINEILKDFITSKGHGETTKKIYDEINELKTINAIRDDREKRKR